MSPACVLAVAPVIMTPRMIGAATVSGRPRASVGGGSAHVDFATLGRAPRRLGFGSRRVTSRDLQIVEATEELLGEEVPEPDVVAQNVSLLRGFNATIPSAGQLLRILLEMLPSLLDSSTALTLTACVSSRPILPCVEHT